jgi:transglutaminase-like putative cysteine protease
MNQRRHITLVSAGATLLAGLPLSSVFEKWTWLVSVLLVVGTMTATAVLLRSVRAPGWAPTLGMIAAYVVTLTWLFSDGHSFLGVVPTPQTVSYFNQLLADAGVTIRESGVPIGDQDGLLFLAALGIGAVLLAIDLAAVVARRPAIAGIPMVAVYLVPVGTHTESVSFLAFVCTAAAFLWLLATDNVDRVRRFGRRFTGDGRDIDVWEPSPLAAAGRRLAIIGVLAAVVLPLAVPGMTTGLLDRFGTGLGNGPGNGPGPGAAGSVSLFTYLQGTLIRESSYDMLKVTTKDPNPFYVRFATAEQLTRDGFVNRPPSQGQPLGNIQPPQLTGPDIKLSTHQAQVEILQFNEKMLPIFQQLTKVERGLDNNWQYDRRAGVVYSNRVNAKNRKYTFTYQRAEFSPDALRTARDLPENDQIRALFTSIPEVREVRAKAQELTAGKTTQYDKVRALYDFFSPANGFTYSTQTVSGNSGTAMVDFISEDGRQGYCEQYAAALAWLVRAAGIPSRVAFGFTKGNNRSGDTYTLSNYNLHAWTEVYFDGFGWVPFDATPASSIAGSVPSSWAPDPTRAQDPTIAPDPDDLPANGGPLTSGSAGPIDPQFGGNDAAAAGGDDSAGPGWPLYLIGGVLLALVLLMLPALRRSSLRRRRWPGAVRGDPVEAPVAVGPDGVRDPVGASGHRRARRDAHAAWDELIDTMIDYRLEIDPAETPRLTGERLINHAQLAAPVASGVTVLRRAEERARYARSPLTDVDLGTPLRDVRVALRDGVSRRTRLVAALLPPSVIGRWRANVGTGYAMFVTGFGRRRDAVSKALSPRRLLAGRAGR